MFIEDALVTGSLDIPGGVLIFLDKVLGVDEEAVKSLKATHPHLETGPPVSGPWPQAQFLSHVIQRLEGGHR